MVRPSLAKKGLISGEAMSRRDRDDRGGERGDRGGDRGRSESRGAGGASEYEWLGAAPDLLPGLDDERVKWLWVNTNQSIL